MARQLLIYETAVPVSAVRHRHTCLEPAGGYAFGAAINAVPLMAAEFRQAAAEYAIVFAPADKGVMPAAVLGVRDQQNLYLAADGEWRARYIPAFIRRYPFVFAGSPDSGTLTLCIDEKHPGVNTAGRGERLFGDDGSPTPFVTRVLEFLKEYQAQFERTKKFGERVEALGLLEPMHARVTTTEGDAVSLGGFFGVSRDKLRGLDGDTLAALAKTDELELLYLQLQSMRNFEEIRTRLVDSTKPDVTMADTALAGASTLQ